MIKFQNDELSEKEGKRRKYFNIYVGMLQMFHLQFTLRSRERKMIRRNEKQIIKNILIYNMNVKKRYSNRKKALQVPCFSAHCTTISNATWRSGIPSDPSGSCSPINQARDRGETRI